MRVTTIIFAETVEEEEEVLRLEQKEIEMIKKSEKNKGKRDELGISERTLYRKIKQFDL
jgi:transcriptional regulator of acetoin/glycerol metabolism